MPALFDTAACTIPGGAGTTSKTYSSPINIGSGSNGTTDRGLVVAVVFVGAAAGTSSGVTATWNGVSMTQLATVGNGGDIFLFGLRAPDTGAHDLVLAWTGANQPSAVLLSCVGVDQTSDALAFPTAHRVTATGSASPNSIAVTNASGNIAFAAHVVSANFSTAGNTDIGHNNTGNLNSLAGNYDTGTDPTLTYAFSSGNTWASVGCEIAAPAAGGGGKPMNYYQQMSA